VEYSTYGRHVIVDTWGVEYDLINDLDRLTKSMTEGLTKSGATIISVQAEKFFPNGITILFLLAESHFSIHTYPEKGFAGIDCYTCGKEIDPQKVIKPLLKYLAPQKVYEQVITRGVKPSG
jgi:S-adenosylmethionine decarboxylase